MRSRPTIFRGRKDKPRARQQSLGSSYGTSIPLPARLGHIRCGRTEIGLAGVLFGGEFFPASSRPCGKATARAAPASRDEDTTKPVMAFSCPVAYWQFGIGVLVELRLVPITDSLFGSEVLLSWSGTIDISEKPSFVTNSNCIVVGKT